MRRSAQTVTYNDRGHGIQNNVLEPRVHVVQDEKRKQGRGVSYARLHNEEHNRA